MNIVFVAAEITPFAKVGGLADVVGSLPKALEKLGNSVSCCIPRYGSLELDHVPLVHVDPTFSVTHAGETYRFQVLEAYLPQSTVPVYFFENRELFPPGEAIYPPDQPVKEILRYEVFGKAVLAWLETQATPVDVLHLHDWHTANLAYRLKTNRELYPFFAGTGTVLSLHNLAYQGISTEHNWLAEGIRYSDAIIAVSPTYAKEILTPEEGCGLEGLLLENRHKLSGILNGLDTELFNPATDTFIPQRYTPETSAMGKAASKTAVQSEMGLPTTTDVPLLAMVTRLVEQKGLDILIPLLEALSERPIQVAILGNGQPEYEAALRAMNANSQNIRVMIGFNMALGQHLYAGSDAFLMPSRFEPCGLGQLIALRYGSLPIVRHTGGLADTVINTGAPEANGFVFDDYTPQAFLAAIDTAIDTWHEHQSTWQQMVARGMHQDFSWTQSAQSYLAAYRHVSQTAQGVSHG